jgi:hypothetical protein
VKSDDELICRVFNSALSMGCVLKERPERSTHQYGQPKKADRPLAEDELREALDSVKCGMDLVRGATAEDLVMSLSLSGGPAWRREALTNVVTAFALIQKHDREADLLACDLLGQAVWDWGKAHDVLGPEIKEIWPTRPSPP